MTSVLDRVPIERIRAEAGQANAGRVLLKLLVGVFFLVGWLAATVFTSLVWCGSAVKVGWQDARPPIERAHGSAG